MKTRIKTGLGLLLLNPVFYRKREATPYQIGSGLGTICVENNCLLLSSFHFLNHLTTKTARRLIPLA